MADSVPAPHTKRLPAWAWCLTLAGFPASIFIAYGFARILPWPRSIALAMLSLASVIGFVSLMVHLEQAPKKDNLDLTMMIADDAGVLMNMAWCYLLYSIGNAAAYWTPGLLRGWRRAKWLGIAVICLMLVPYVAILIIKLVAMHRQ